MKLGIMQPYFFPYIGYFQLIKAVDKWIVFDVVQYMRHHWLNRNRILHPNSGWQYITVPLQKYHREILIKDVLTKEGNEWKERIIAQLGHYKKKARYYNNTIEFVRECLFSTEKSCLARLNTEILKKICDHLCIDFDYSICSEMDLSFDGVDVIYSGSNIEDCNLTSLNKGGRYAIDWRFKMPLMQGKYNISRILAIPMAVELGKVDICDFVPLTVQFEMMPRVGARIYGLVHLENKVDVVKMPATKAREEERC